ncbi:MAG: hypothetical protein N2652_08505 [Kiritimatiellae bacterium]|nr:hypothetical protein [Kiritimatiellia bacterium]
MTNASLSGIVLAIAGWIASVPSPATPAGPSAEPVGLRLDGDRVWIEPGQRNRRILIDALARALGARLNWPADLPDRTADYAMSGVPVERALVHLLYGVDWTVVWRAEQLPDRVRWWPAEIRVGAAARTPGATGGHNDLPSDTLGESTSAGAASPSVLREAAARWLDPAEPEQARTAAIDTLARLADAPLLAELEAAHRVDGDVAAYTRVLEIVRRCRSEAAVPLLSQWAAEIVNQPGSPRARAALQGLASVGSAPALDQILDQFDTASDDVRAALRDALLAATPTAPALAALRSAAEGRRGAAGDDVRLAALDSLARFPDALAVELVRRLSRSDLSPAVRARAAELAQEWTQPLP